MSVDRRSAFGEERFRPAGACRLPATGSLFAEHRAPIGEAGAGCTIRNLEWKEEFENEFQMPNPEFLISHVFV